jgi:hypothetical protein
MQFNNECQTLRIINTGLGNDEFHVCESVTHLQQSTRVTTRFLICTPEEHTD